MSMLLLFQHILVPAIVGQDSFTEASDTFIESHTPDVGAGWTPSANSEIEINSVVGVAFSTDTTTRFARKGDDIGDDDMDVSAVVTISTGVSTALRWVGVCARMTAADFDNMYFAYRESSSGSHDLVLIKRVDGVNTELGRVVNSIAGGSAPVVKLEIRAGSQKVYQDGVLKITATEPDTTLAGNRYAGIILNSNDTTSTAIDNFLSESVGLGGATWREALNTPTTLNLSGGNVQLRLRVAVLNSGDVGVTGFRWQYRKNAGAWTDLTASSANVKTFGSAYYSDGDDVPQLLTADPYLTANNAAEEDTGALTLSTGLPPNTGFESEVALELIAADLIDADTLEFRLAHLDGTALNSYTQTPQITVSIPVGGPVTLSGTITSASSLTAALARSAGMTANVQMTSTVEDALSASRSVQSDLVSESQIAATLSIEGIVALAAVLATQSQLSGVLAADRPLSSVMTAESIVASAITLIRAIQGTSIQSSTIEAGLARLASMASDPSQQSVVTGMAQVARLLTGSFITESTVVSDSDVARLMAATISSLTQLDADLTIQGQVTFAAVLTSASLLSAAIQLERPLASLVRSDSQVLPALSRLRPLASLVLQESTVTALMTRFKHLSSTISSDTEIAADIKRLVGLEADVVVVSLVDVVAELARDLVGSVSSASMFTAQSQVDRPLAGQLSTLTAIVAVMATVIPPPALQAMILAKDRIYLVSASEHVATIDTKAHAQ